MKTRVICFVAIVGVVLGSTAGCKKKKPEPTERVAPTTASAGKSTKKTTAPKESPGRAATGVSAKDLAPAAADKVPAACAGYDKGISRTYLPYLNAFHNIGHSFTPDGKRFLFKSNRGGKTMQFYLAPVGQPAAAAKEIAPAKDRIAEARITRDGKHVLFTRDKGFNENFQIYRVSLEGGAAVPLTKRLDHFHYLPKESPDGKTLYYFTGVHKKGEFELVAQPAAGGKTRSIYKGKGFHVLLDLSPDGTQALMMKYLSLSRSQLDMVNLRDGKIRRIAPSPGAKAHAADARFANDGKSVYYVTDEGVARAELRRIALAGGKRLASYAHPEGEVSAVQLARKGGTVVVQIDYGSHNGVKVLDAASLREKVPVRFPLAYVAPGKISADGSKLMLTVSRPDQPTEAFSLDLGTGRVVALRADKRPGLERVAKARVKVQRIPTFDRWKVPVNVYLPVKAKAGARLPVLVSVHGGPAASSAVHWNPFNAFFISRGFAVVEPNVRGSTGFGKAYEKADNGRKRMDALKDLRFVNRWVRRQPWADPDRVVIFGGSYGGYMTYMALGHQPKLWRAGLGAVGVVNLKTFLKNTMGAIRIAFREEFGDIEKDGAFLDSISPLRVVHRYRAPLFVYQGANDQRVPRSEQDLLVRTVRKRGIPVEYMVSADEGHSMSHKHTQLEMAGRVFRFLDAHLGRPGPSGACLKAMGISRGS